MARGTAPLSKGIILGFKLMTTINESYPNIGYVLNRLADIADTKSLATKGKSRFRKEEDLASRKSIDPTLIGEVFKEELETMFLTAPQVLVSFGSKTNGFKPTLIDRFTCKMVLQNFLSPGIFNGE